MMVALLVYAYAIGMRSSRAIERRCREDVAFRVMTANQAPDHATIARFRVRHETAIAALFGGVLELCARAGLVELGVVVVDGTRIAASAADRQTRSYEQIVKEILGEAAALDAAEDERYGDERGDELPPGFRNQGDRRTRLREAKRALDAQPPRRPRRSPATAASGCMSAAGVSTRTGRWSVGSLPTRPPGLRPGSPATDRGG
jgi:hypothetical protein